MSYTIAIGCGLVVIMLILIINDYLHQYQQFKIDQVKQQHNYDLTNQMLELLDQFDQWNSIIETKEGFRDLLGVLNELCVRVFDTSIEVNITEDEFNRMSIQQLQLSVDQLIDQIRYQITSSTADHVIGHQEL